MLSDFQVTIPELGTIRADHRPHVILTSNRTREIGDALRRRCLYLYIDHPSLEKEVRIMRARVPEADEHPRARDRALRAGAARAAAGAQPGRRRELDWARALARLHAPHLDAETVAATLGCVIKDRRDQLPDEEVERLVDEAKAS